MERTMREAGGRPLVIAFISYRCPHCRRFLPILEALCQEMPDVIFKKVDVNASEELRDEYGIESVPDTYLFKNGILSNRIAGADKESLLNSLQFLRN
ncbi:thioredoxin-like [Hyla sarda]|uniref:thioredoxin-like n=1 Tax=Hyla sarda TaxID=327740 RepID=UPI0024C31679|nr:thioredoxin-like [Hyla sarda]XP_056408105.1 thioredoxin-like [Hyla sarda]XP_056408106.1 thioredoxin-like [Hyla sarda]